MLKILTRADPECAHHVGGTLHIPSAGDDAVASDARVPVESLPAGAEGHVVAGPAVGVGAAHAVQPADVLALVVHARLAGGAVGVLHAFQFDALGSNGQKGAGCSWACSLPPTRNHSI